jgi:hypothetical protein
MKKSILFLLCILGAFHATAQKPVPYLQTPSDSSIWITWRTAIETSLESKVYYGLSADALVNMTEGSTQDLRETTVKYYYHSVQLKGLQPSTRYFYKVVSDNIESEIYSFRTQPENGSQGIYRFLILGDHQLFDDRYERLMKAAKSVCEAKYGTPIENYINMITNVGDQVDTGTLEHYDQVHFKRSETLSPNLPIMTIVGNHETYGTLGLNAYSAHYFYDEIEYQNISSNSEYYYAYQVGRALFIMMSSESVHTNNTQLAWISNVIDAAKTDPYIDWIFSYNHRPLQAEQYIGDVSPWVRDKVMPLLNTTEKSVMNVSGHHHLYHRGTLRDYPTYHIINGGAAWDQRWGQSTEKDFDDVQKTIDYWPFNIVELNPETRTMYVETYVIGNQVETLTQPTLVDTFFRTFGQPKPDKPSVETVESSPIELPYTFVSSPYSTTSEYEYNSVQFQVAAANDFAKLEFDLIRDFENIYGAHPAGCILTDLNQGVDIFRQTIEKNQLFNGGHYIRVRHRDRNMEWSEWSDPVSFETTGGLAGEPSIISAKRIYATGEELSFSFANATDQSNQWIGVYLESQAAPYSNASTSKTWAYVSGEAGTKTFSFNTPGVYHAVLFKDGGYTVLAETDLFYIGNIPVLSTDKRKYDTGEAITVNYENAPRLSSDWIGIYKMGDIPGPVASAAWAYITSASSLNIQSANLKKGYYFVSYLMQDRYFEPGERVYIQIGDDISSLALNKEIFDTTEKISFRFEDGPGTPKDYIGIYKEGDVYGVDELTHYLYVNGEVFGTVEWENHNLPAGNYYAHLFINDSYDAVSNKVEFTVLDDSTPIPIDKSFNNNGIQIYQDLISGKLIITNTTQTPQKTVIYDINGRLMEIINLAAETTVISNRSLKSGVHIVRIYSSNESQTKKLIV